MSDLRRERELAIKRLPVTCPKCGGHDIVAGDPTGYACDGCGHAARLKEFRRTAAKPLDESLTAAEEEKMAEVLAHYPMEPDDR